MLLDLKSTLEILKTYTKPASLFTVPDYNVIIFENLRFRPSTRKHENGVFENLHSGERFRKPPFSHAENTVTEPSPSY